MSRTVLLFETLANSSTSRKTAHLPLLLSLFQSWSSAQNIVVNPSFEQLKPNAIVVPCQFMQASVFFGENIETWTTFPDMTPDVLRAAAEGRQKNRRVECVLLKQ